MKHLRPVNRKARRIDDQVTGMRLADPVLGFQGDGDAGGTPIETHDVVALQQGPQTPQTRPHVPMGCSLAFSPGWEVDSAGGTAGLCQPVERDIYDCYVTCFWPAQVPDHLVNYPNWAGKCAAATKDWRNLDLVFP